MAWQRTVGKQRGSTGDEVRYCITPVLVQPDGTTQADASQASNWTDWTTLTPTAGDASSYFNRGLVMSQFMARALKGDFSIKALRKFTADLSNHACALRNFLGVELPLPAILAAHGQAAVRSAGVRRVPGHCGHGPGRKSNGGFR